MKLPLSSLTISEFYLKTQIQLEDKKFSLSLCIMCAQIFLHFISVQNQIGATDFNMCAGKLASDI